MSGIDRHLHKKLILSAVLVFMVNASAHARTIDQNLARCEGNDADVAITACTAVIGSGRLPQRALAAVYSNRGGAHLKKQAYALAIADFDQAITLDPTNATNVHNRGFAFETTGKLDEAIRDYSRAIEFNPDHTVSYSNRGRAYERLGQHERALQDLSRYITLAPRDVRAFDQRGTSMRAEVISSARSRISTRWFASRPTARPVT